MLARRKVRLHDGFRATSFDGIFSSATLIDVLYALATFCKRSRPHHAITVSDVALHSITAIKSLRSGYTKLFGIHSLSKSAKFGIKLKI
jgi:hypothetical protein